MRNLENIGVKVRHHSQFQNSDASIDTKLDSPRGIYHDSSIELKQRMGAFGQLGEDSSLKKDNSSSGLKRSSFDKTENNHM